jgi:uncharacterized protein (TIGR03083 family)
MTGAGPLVPAGPILPGGDCGLAQTPPDVLGRSVLAAWDAFLEVVTSPTTDLSRPSRLPGWSGRDVCLHLGAWPDSRVVASLLASAREGGTGTAPPSDDTNAALLAAHRDATPDEVVQSLVDARADLQRLFASDDVHTLGRALSRSVAGPLPVLCLVNAGTFELAVHALDLAPCGAPPPPAVLLDSGLSALLDVTGALASRAGVEIALGAQTPSGGWGFSADGVRGWRTGPLPPGRLTGVGVEGTSEDLLDAAAGRTHLAQLLVTRRLVVHQLPQWMRLAPLLDDVPGLPGGATLKGAVGSVTGLVGGVGRVLGRLRR